MLLRIDAATKIPLAVKVGKMQEHEALWTRALVTQARMQLVGEGVFVDLNDKSCSAVQQIVRHLGWGS